METKTLTADQAGERLDAFLARSLPDLTRSAAQRMLEEGAVTLGGKPAKKNTKTAPGDVVEVTLPDPQPVEVVPQNIPLDIVYEDPDLLVLNKASGVAVHPGPGHYNDTIGNFLLHYYDSRGEEGDFHPVHRLDRGTSGLMVVARHPHAQEILKGQLHTADFHRTYLAVCEGAPEPPAGTVDAPLGPREGSLVEQCVRPDGKPARTRYETLWTDGTRSLLRLELDTGRTHQIRVHMAYLGHPLVGDFLYGMEAPELIPRPALHSWQVTFRHPITAQELTFTAPLPRDMEALLPPEVGSAL